MKVMIVKELITGDVSPVAMFEADLSVDWIRQKQQSGVSSLKNCRHLCPSIFLFQAFVSSYFVFFRHLCLHMLSFFRHLCLYILYCFQEFVPLDFVYFESLSCLFPHAHIHSYLALNRVKIRY